MPVDFPAYAFTGIDAAPDLAIAFAQSAGGIVITSRSADPTWRGRFTTAALTVTPGGGQHANLRAFLSRAIDLHQRVDIVHPRHRYPAAYDAATWPLIATPSLVEVTTAREIVVSGLQVGMTLQRGDRLSLVQGDLIAHRWIGVDVTVSSALSQTLELTPRLPFGVFATDASVVFEDPKMRVLIVPGSVQAAETAEPSAISFDVVEALA